MFLVAYHNVESTLRDELLAETSKRIACMFTVTLNLNAAGCTCRVEGSERVQVGWGSTGQLLAGRGPPW